MAVDIGMFRVLVSTAEVNGVYSGHWHISRINPDGSSDPFVDRPAAGTFDSEEAARSAALEAGVIRAGELDTKHRAWPYTAD